MNKKNIVESISKSINLSNEDKEIIKEIEKAKQEWEDAAQFFEFVNEPEMVDYAIYLQQAACVKYMHLLKQAKEKEITISYYRKMKELGMR